MFVLNGTNFISPQGVVKSSKMKKYPPLWLIAKTEGVFESLEYIATDCIIASNHPLRKKCGESSQTQ
jgi:hypothetical protein